MSVKINGKKVGFPLDVIITLAVLPLIGLIICGIFLAIAVFFALVIGLLPIWLPILIITSLLGK